MLKNADVKKEVKVRVCYSHYQLKKYSNLPNVHKVLISGEIKKLLELRETDKHEYHFKGISLEDLNKYLEQGYKFILIYV